MGSYRSLLLAIVPAQFTCRRFDVSVPGATLLDCLVAP